MMAPKVSRSQRNKSSSRQVTPILFSDIKYNSTCITLKIPFILACSDCRPQLDPLENKQKKQKMSGRRHHAEGVSNIGAHNMDMDPILQKEMQ